MKKALVLVFSNLKHDARVTRQIGFLKKRFQVTVCCHDAPATDEFRVIKFRNLLDFKRKAIGGILLLLRQYRMAHRTLYPYRSLIGSSIKNEHFDLIIANDVETLPLAFAFKQEGTRVIFDAHEYAPRHFEDKLWWRVFFMDFNNDLCKVYIPKVDGMITISKTLADEYEKNFSKKPIVITNAGPYYDLQPRASGGNAIKLVHHGIVGISRRIELIIGMMKHLPQNFTLDLVLVVPTLSSKKTLDYLQYLKDLSAGDSRITFRDPVTIDKIIPLLQEYDMGIILAPPVNFNYVSGLPNKLFDYIQARIGTITSPTLEIARVVREYNIGVVGTDFTSAGMAEKVAVLTRKEIDTFKKNSMIPARELNAESNEVVFNQLVDKVFS